MDGAGVEPEQAAPLFRPEALDAAKDRLGSPVRAVGIASWMLATFMTALLLTAIIFLSLTRYARRETVAGELEPASGALRVTSLRPGVVTAVNVSEGQDVLPGRPLIALALDPTMSDGRRLSDALGKASVQQDLALTRQAAAQHDLIEREREELAAKRQGLLDQQRRFVTDAALQRERVELAEQTAQASRTLWTKELMSAVQYRQREDALIMARQALSSIERDQAAIPSSLAELTAEDRRLAAQDAEAEATAASSRAQLDEKRAETQAETQIVLTAPVAGQIAALQAKPGGAVNAGQTLAFVLPRGVRLRAELWAPSRAAGFVRRGDKVRLMYDAFPYQRFGVGHGHVLEVARAPTAPADLPPSMSHTEESLYRVLVELDDQDVRGYGQAWRLSPGMRLTADMVLEQQTLLAWLFDKVRAAETRAQPL